MNCLIFDIETVPDTELGAQLLGLEGLADADIAEAMYTLRLQETGNDFLPLYQHRVVAISAVLRRADRVTVWSLGETDSSEAELVSRFFEGVERYRPTLVSWNGSGFDLPVLHYRALKHGVQAPVYWETGDNDREFRFNNYISRYHQRHTDVMDLISGYQPRARAPLDAMATMLGFPGKMGMSGAKVWESFQAGDLAGIRNYCETDVLNTYLVYLRFQHMRGELDDVELEREFERLREHLGAAEQDHLQAFLAAWQAGAAA